MQKLSRNVSRGKTWHSVATPKCYTYLKGEAEFSLENVSCQGKKWLGDLQLGCYFVMRQKQELQHWTRLKDLKKYFFSLKVQKVMDVAATMIYIYK